MKKLCALLIATMFVFGCAITVEPPEQPGADQHLAANAIGLNIAILLGEEGNKNLVRNLYPFMEGILAGELPPDSNVLIQEWLNQVMAECDNPYLAGNIVLLMSFLPVVTYEGDLDPRLMWIAEGFILGAKQVCPDLKEEVI